MKLSLESGWLNAQLEFRRRHSSLSNMNDWAKNAADKLKAQRHAKAIADEKFVQEQRIKEARGAPLWDEVREAVRAKCDAFNLEMGETILHFRVTATPTIQVDANENSLIAEFKANQNAAKWSIVPTGGHGEWELDVYSAKPVFIEMQMPRHKVDPEKMATTMLDALLRQ